MLLLLLLVVGQDEGLAGDIGRGWRGWMLGCRERLAREVGAWGVGVVGRGERVGCVVGCWGGSAGGGRVGAAGGFVGGWCHCSWRREGVWRLVAGEVQRLSA